MPFTSDPPGHAAADDTHLLRPAAVAARLDVGQRTLWRWIGTGRFPRPDVRCGAKVVRWKASTVAAWITANAATTGEGR